MDITTLHDDLKEQFLDAIQNCNNDFDRYLEAMWFYTQHNPYLRTKTEFTDMDKNLAELCSEGFKKIDEKLKQESNQYRINLMMALSKRINQHNNQ